MDILLEVTLGLVVVLGDTLELEHLLVEDIQVDSTVSQRSPALDQDNCIDANDLGQALANGDLSTFSQEVCQMMITMFDKNLSGSIDFNEFGPLFQYINQWKAKFDAYDKDKSGQMD